MTEQAESRTFKDASYDEQQAAREGFAGFLKDGSLYQNHTLQILPDEFAQIRPEMLHLYCGRCKRENPFRSPEFRDAKLQSEADIGRDIYGEHPRETTHKKALKSRVYVVMLECTACKREQFTCWIEIDTDKKRARKIGQAPEPSVAVPPDVKEALGDDERLYRRARVCLNFSLRRRGLRLPQEDPREPHRPVPRDRQEHARGRRGGRGRARAHRRDRPVQGREREDPARR